MKNSYIFILIIFLIFSCKPKTKEKIVENVNFDSIQIHNQIDEVFYLIPSPYEISEYLNQNNKKISVLTLNSISNANLYQIPTNQAINLGVYLSDLAYLSLSGDYNNSAQYFYVMNKLCEELQIPILNNNFLERINNNLTNSDSLNIISEEFYSNINNFLTNNDKEKLFSLIVSGFFIESLYISINLENEFSEQNEMLKRIYDNNFILDNIIITINKFSENEDVNNVLTNLLALKQEFAKINIVVQKKYSTNKDSIIINGSREINITKENFEAIKNQINKIRKIFIQLK